VSHVPEERELANVRDFARGVEVAPYVKAMLLGVYAEVRIVPRPHDLPIG
jgi:hypothetical protein